MSSNQLANVSSGELLEAFLAKPFNHKIKAIGDALEQRIDSIESMLPDFMEGQGARLAKRAQMTFAANPDLQACPPDEFIRCVLEAAEFGFAIDGKMAYVVKYKSKFQMQLDYKALVAVAKRMGTIRDIYAEIVCENDDFRAWREDGAEHLRHERVLGLERGKEIGAYAIVVLADGRWRYELMDMSELNAIEARAPSKKGPWSTDKNEMRRKTILRKTLKLYGDDPGVLRLLELTDEEVEVDENPQAIQDSKDSIRSQLARRLKPKALEQKETITQEFKVQEQPEPESIIVPQEELPSTQQQADVVF